MASAPDSLRVSLAGLDLRNPLILAAGTCGYVDEMADVLDLSRIGGLVTKSITALAREGNQTWRVIPTRAGMMNAIGLANVGIEAFVREHAPRIAATPTTVIGSVAGYSIDDYVKVCAAMDAIESIRAVELNVSCPNVHGGCEFGADPRQLAELVAAVRPALTRTRLFVKLSPIAVGVPGIVPIATAAIDPGSVLRGAPSPGEAEQRDLSTHGPNQRPGADALCLCNTMPAMAIDARTRRPRLANRTGGLSGPAVHPIVVKIIHDVYRAVAKSTGTPIVGIGGVMTWEDAAEFVLAGASAVQVGTGLFADPRVPIRIARGLERWAREQSANSIADLVGAVRLDG
jgi:dihydroorotate dehydrogenase (NAD+) catalytic subunit